MTTRLKTLWPSALFVVIGAVAASIGNGYQQFILANVALTAAVGIGLNVLLGLAGQISLGHAAFYAIGAYTAAILATALGWNMFAGALAAALISAAAGAALSLPALRVRGPYLAMITIAFGFVVEQGIAEWKSLTGGWNGLMNIPKPSIGTYTFDERDLALLCVLLTGGLMLGFHRLHASRWGLVLRATRDAEVAAQSLGANLIAARTLAFAISAGVTGLAGALFGSLNGFISPESFPFFQSIAFLLVVLVGGVGTMSGPVLGALVVVLLPEMLSFLAEYRLLMFGVLLFIVLLLAPGGLVGLLQHWWEQRRQRDACVQTPQANAAFVDTWLRKAAQIHLEVQDVSIRFGGNQAVGHVSLLAAGGKITSLIGPNGAGKTTLLNLISGFYAPDQGHIRLHTQALAGLASWRIARAGVARTFQTSQLFSGMQIDENLRVAMLRGRLWEPGSKQQADPALAQALLAWVGYQGDPSRLGGALAHVDRRLVEIARALAMQPDVLLLDEPAAGLSAEEKQQLGAVLQRIAALGIAVLLIEHDMQLVMGISDQLFVLDAGRRIADGTPVDIQRNPEVQRAYLGSPTTATPAIAQNTVNANHVAAPRGELLLAAQQLSAAYGTAPALHGLSLDVHAGEVVAVLGANGAGKSTLLRAMAGLHRPVTGGVFFSGHQIAHLPAHQIARRALILVPEGRQVFPELSVEENLRLGAYRLDALHDAELQSLYALFPKLAQLKSQPAGLLSGGEQQMLAIARGLAAQPRVLLLDEPSLGLAPAIVQELFATLATLRTRGITLLLVDQMARMALTLADRATVLNAGQVVYAGNTAALENADVLAQAYLGSPPQAKETPPTT